MHHGHFLIKVQPVASQDMMRIAQKYICSGVQSIELYIYTFLSAIIIIIFIISMIINHDDDDDDDDDDEVDDDDDDTEPVQGFFCLPADSGTFDLPLCQGCSPDNHCHQEE